MAGTAQAQPNIALIKYWGKRDTSLNLPATGSLSITLDSLWTRTHVEFDASLECDQLRLNGALSPNAMARAAISLDALRACAGVNLRTRIDSRNNFPTGTGLASSASGVAALVMAASAALDLDLDRGELSGIARCGSGSAARSLYGGFVLMDAGLRGDGSDAHARLLLTPDEWPLAVVIAMTSRHEKNIDSRTGMEISRRTSPFYPQWLIGADDDLAIAQAAVLSRDFEALAAISEHNCLKMHAVMLASRPPLMYWNGVTLECLHRIRALRESEGVGAFFTVDAGPQVIAVCLPGYAQRVAADLGDIPGVEKVLCSALGEGARVLPAEEVA